MILNILKESLKKKIWRTFVMSFVAGLAMGLADKIVIPQIKKKLEPKRKKK